MVGMTRTTTAGGIGKTAFRCLVRAAAACAALAVALAVVVSAILGAFR